MRRLEGARALSVAAWTATPILLALAAWLLSRADTPPAYGRGLIAGEWAAIHFEDIAARAGLTAVNVNGGDKAKRYILESTGSGIAFLDYDNDGLLDIFVVKGTRMGPPRGAPPTNHLIAIRAIGLLSMSLSKPAWSRPDGGKESVPATTITTVSKTSS